MCVRLIPPFSPSQRPTTEELVQMLPAKVEDSSVKEMLNALSNKDTSAHTTLMQTIFGQVGGVFGMMLCCHTWQASRMTHEYTYGVDASLFPVMELGFWTQIRNESAHIMMRHGQSMYWCFLLTVVTGAVELCIPLLLPVSEKNTTAEDAVKLLDTSGNIVQLPYSLQHAFARCVRSHERCGVTLRRFVSRKRINSIRRFTIEPIYRERFSQQPLAWPLLCYLVAHVIAQEDYSCCYDVVTNTGILGHASPSFITAEVLKVTPTFFSDEMRSEAQVLIDVVEATLPGRKIIVRVGHIRLLRNLLEAEGLNEVQVRLPFALNSAYCSDQCCSESLPVPQAPGDEEAVGPCAHQALAGRRDERGDSQEH
jgi:hypothetical protein